MAAQATVPVSQHDRLCLFPGGHSLAGNGLQFAQVVGTDGQVTKAACQCRRQRFSPAVVGGINGGEQMEAVVSITGKNVIEFAFQVLTVDQVHLGNHHNAAFFPGLFNDLSQCVPGAVTGIEVVNGRHGFTTGDNLLLNAFQQQFQGDILAPARRSLDDGGLSSAVGTVTVKCLLATVQILTELMHQFSNGIR